jgi:hypothetical protein
MSLLLYHIIQKKTAILTGVSFQRFYYLEHFQASIFIGFGTSTYFICVLIFCDPFKPKRKRKKTQTTSKSGKAQNIQ